MTTEPFASVDELLRALESLDGEHSEDVVPALPHLLQTAERLASTHPHDTELIVAGLVHDLASALDPGCIDHAAVGSKLVHDLLGARVAGLVAGHTDAKRYLVATDAAYAGCLSDNSTATLVGQGGPMTRAEVAAFTGRREWTSLVDLRRADDAAKVPDRQVRPAAAWRPMLDEVALNATVRGQTPG